MNGDSETLVINWIYQFCGTCIPYVSVPLYVISYVIIQYTSECCWFSFTYGDIIWLTEYCSENKFTMKRFILLLSFSIHHY